MADEKKTTGVEETEEEDVTISEEKTSEETGGEKKTEEKGKTEEKTFTQSQVNKMMTREKGQGRNAALKELGIDPKNTTLLASVKAFIESQKTDDQKKAEKEAAEAEAISKAEERAAIAEAKAEAMMLGVQKQFVDDVVVLATAKLAESEGGDLKTIIGELKTKYPIWFGESSEDDDKKKTGQKGTGSSMKTGEKGKSSGKAESGLGARLAAQRKPAERKNSFWGK